jgi:hypothetical protein
VGCGTGPLWLLVGGGCGLCSQFMGCGGPSSLLSGGGGGPSSPLAGGGDVPPPGHCCCGWGPCSLLVGYDAGPSSAVVVGLCLLCCPLPFSLSFRHVIVVWCHQCVVSLLRTIFIVPLHLCTPSPSLSVVKEKTMRNDDIKSTFLVW